jgi:hypothetical protein
MKILYIYRPKPKASHYKPVFFTPEEEQSTLEKKMKSHHDQETPLRERLSKRWEEERKYKSVSQKTLLTAILVIAALIYIIFFL